MLQRLDCFEENSLVLESCVKTLCKCLARFQGSVSCSDIVAAASLIDNPLVRPPPTT
jgi:hypothetical protein